MAVPAELEKISLMRAGCPDTPLCVDLDSLLPAAVAPHSLPAGAAPHSHSSPPAAIEPHLLESFAEHVDCFFAASCIQVSQHTQKKNEKTQYACMHCMQVRSSPCVAPQTNRLLTYAHRIIRFLSDGGCQGRLVVVRPGRRACGSVAPEGGLRRSLRT